MAGGGRFAKVTGGTRDAVGILWARPRSVDGAPADIFFSERVRPTGRLGGDAMWENACGEIGVQFSLPGNENSGYVF